MRTCPPGARRALLLAAALVAAAQPTRAAPFRISTWNLDWLTLRPQGDPSLPDDVHVRDPADFVRLAGIARRLDPDVAALEEIDGAAPAARLFPPDRYRVLVTADDVVQRVALAVRDGIAIERHPDVTGLDVEPEARFRLRSGLDATVTAGGARFRLLAVHLKSGCWGRREDDEHRAACAELDRQVPVLAAWIAARRAEGGPFVVLGDFNRRLLQGDPVLEALQRAAPLTSVTMGRSDPCWGEHRDFIDQILLFGPARDWLVPDSLRVLRYRTDDKSLKDHLSDHCPVSVTLDPHPGATG